MVTPNGSKLWRLAYRFHGKQKLLALGAYPAVTLGQARGRRDDAKRLLAQGVDPSVQARQDKLDRQALSTNTFELIAEDFLPSHRQAELFQRFREAERSGNAMDL